MSNSKYQIDIRDAQGVVIGDHNAVYQSFLDERYWPLVEHFISFDDLIAERTADFVGREFLDERLASFMARHDRGYFVPVGEPGTDKTAWAAHVVQKWRTLHHFNVAAIGITRPEQCLENLCAQLSRLMDKVKSLRVKSMIALAMGETGSQQVVPKLLHMLKTERRQGSWAAADALIALSDYSAVPALLDLYWQTSSRADKERVLYILGWLKAEEARTLLADALGSSVVRIVGRAVDLMWQLRPAAGDLPFLLAKLDAITNSDPAHPEKLGPWGDEWVQKRLVRALTKRGGPEMVRPLRHLQDHVARRSRA